MRVLLDNCVPLRFGKYIVGHEVESVVKIGWAELDDGPLLDAMTGQFDVLVTVDKNIPNQQRLDHRPLAVVLLSAKSNKLSDLVPLASALLASLDIVEPGEVREIAAD